MSAPQISVIIPHLNQPEHLQICLASLAAQVDAPLFEVFVVDNGSHEPPPLPQTPPATLLSESTPGPGPARNRGIAAAQGEILAFIDADCRADPHWLARIAAHFAAHADHDILGGDVRVWVEDKDRSTLLEAYEGIYAYRMKEYIAKQGFTGTGNLAVRASTMKAVGPFAGLEVAEDRDWGQRALAAGWRTTYVPDMLVFHPARKTFAELQEKWDRHIAHEFVHIQARRHWRGRWLAWAAALAASPLPEIWRILRSDRIAGVRTRWLAWAGLIRIRFYRAAVMVRLLVQGNADALRSGWNRG